MPRIFAMLMIGMLFYLPSKFDPLALGPTLAPLFLSFGLTFFGLAIGDAALRVMQPYVDSQAAAREAMQDGNVAAGLVYAGRCLLAAVILLIIVSASRV
jgi:hypothetical protein